MMRQNSIHIGVIEDVNTEFKTSLFFRAETSALSDEQIDVITRTIASMMNMNGGTLYLGVNDKGYATNSVTEEYQYLNTFLPYPNNVYSPSYDGYKRFILDWINKNLGNFATTLVSLDFVDYNGIVICKINIKKSRTPIWFKFTSLYVRADASTRQLRGNDITNFIMQIDKEDFLKANNNDKQAFRKRLDEIKKNEPRNDHILVVYPNGEYIHEKKDVDTLLAVIHKAGVEDVKKLGLVGRNGRGKTPFVPFIGEEIYLDGADHSGKTQHELDGYLVFTKTATGEKISKLTEISNGLGLNLHIERY